MAQIGVREHGDLKRMAREVAAIDDRYDTKTSRDDKFFAYVMSRDFEAAASVVEAMPEEGATPMGLSDRHFNQLVVSHFLGDEDKVAELTALGRRNLEESGVDPEAIRDYRAIALAAFAALEGDAEAAERFIQQYYRGSGTDWANRVFNRDFTCQILGVAGVADAAVQCIRDGLEEPSYVMPFLEPHLPFYDPIRNEPVFVQLLEELETS